MVYTGKGGTIYFGIESAGFGQGNPVVDVHIPFNPMLNFMNPKPRYTETVERTFDKLEPKIVYTNELTPGERQLDAMVFKDPFLMLTMFTNKTVGGTWVAGTGTITADMTTEDDKDSIWIKYKLKDQSLKNHQEYLLKGCILTNYQWIIEPGILLKEQPTIKCINFEANTQPMNSGTDFHDDSFDKTGAAQVQTIIAQLAADFTTGQYFTIQGISALRVRTDYYVWFNKDAGGGDPAPTGYTAILVAVTTGETAQQVSDLITAAINAIGNFGAANGGGASTTITVTNANNGEVVRITDVDTDLTLAVTTFGEIGIEGGWANWDNSGLGSTGKRSPKNIVIHLGDAVFSGFEIIRGNLNINLEDQSRQTQDSLTHDHHWQSIRDFSFEVTGILTNLTYLTQIESLYSAKTLATLRIYYDAAVGEEKYLQFTNGYISALDVIDIPAAGEAVELSMTVIGGEDTAVSFSGKYLDQPDPDALITD